MVLWCKKCEAFMGVREPITDWTVDRQKFCPYCIAQELSDTEIADNAAIEFPANPTNPDKLARY